MDFSESIQELADRAQKIKSSLTTEEATNMALVMPFIRALGYDVFNPLEVVPEFVADIAGQKGEKVDYAIIQEGKPIMIIECKCCGANLGDVKREQLHRYFLTLDSSVGILTDGIRYLFFSTADDGKNMDATPFMEFSLDDVDPVLLPELRKLCKGKFDLKNTLDTVAELKFKRQVKLALAGDLETPDMDLIDYFLSKAGIKNQYRKTKEEKYAPWVKKALKEFIDEQVDGRLKTALAATSKKEEEPQAAAAEPAVVEPEITENEWQAFYLVKSILMGTVDADRVYLRNLSGKGRSTVVLDDTIRRQLVRLLFHIPDRMTVELVGQGKDWISHTITKVDDLLQYAEAIRETAKMYLAGKIDKAGEESKQKPDAGPEI